MRSKKTQLALGLVALLLAAPAAMAKWKTVTVVVEAPDGSTEEIRGSNIAYGYYVREFTHKGVKDQLKVVKHVVFPDRNIRFPDLSRIDFTYEDDPTRGIKVPTMIKFTYAAKKGADPQTSERPIGSLRGFEHPQSVRFVVTTAEGDVEIDLTPSADSEQSTYRPITEVVFE